MLHPLATYKMKYLIYILFPALLFSCNSEQPEMKRKTESIVEAPIISKSKILEKIIGERIDGPANIRSKPNGEIFFELYDNVLVEVSSEPENDWYQVLVYSEIDYAEFGLDSMVKDRPLIVDGDTIGKVLKTHAVGTGQAGNFAFADLYGYTHKDNIKPETVIESVFKRELLKNGRKLSQWKGFIDAFDLETDAFDYREFQTFYNYENTLDDPSPGFRIVLLFEKDDLIGFIHSRELVVHETQTHKLNWSYYVTFFEEYPEKEQLSFVNYMNEWIQGVD